MKRYVKIAVTLLIIVAASIVLWKSTANKLREEAARVSDDTLSQEIGARWGGGLPAGFTKTEINNLDAEGHLFAKLVYSESVEDLLQQWEPLDAETEARFAELMEAHASVPSLSEEHRTALQEHQPGPDESWLCYSAESEESPGAQLVLLYDVAAMTIYLAEYQP